MHLVKKCLKGILLLSCFIFYPCIADEASNNPVPKDLQELKSAIDNKVAQEKRQQENDPDKYPPVYNIDGKKITLHYTNPGQTYDQVTKEYMQAHPDIYISNTSPIALWVKPHFSALPPRID